MQQEQRPRARGGWKPRSARSSRCLWLANRASPSGLGASRARSWPALPWASGPALSFWPCRKTPKIQRAFS